MSSKIIKNHLQKLRDEKKYDADFVAVLQESNDSNDDGSTTAEKIIAVIEKRYAENKENKT